MKPQTLKAFEKQTGLRWNDLAERAFDLVRARKGVRANDIYLRPGQPPFTPISGRKWRIDLCFELEAVRPGDEVYAATVELIVVEGGEPRFEGCQWGERIR